MGHWLGDMVTGREEVMEKVITRPSTKEYRKGWERVFGGEKPREPWQEVGQRCGWTSTGICQARIARACN